MDIIKQLNWRYATKVFDKNKKIDAETWQKLADSLILSPSSFGLQPWKFIVVTDEEIRQKLLPLSWNQTQVTNCSHFVVLCAKEDVTNADIGDFLDSTVKARGGTREDLQMYQDMMEGFVSNMDADTKFNWAKNQVYIALGQLMVAAAALEVDACPMEGITPPEFDKILELEGYKTVVACALGYRSEDDKYADLAKVRYSEEQVIEYK